MSYEYKVVPAPKRGLKAKGVKSPEDRFANALQTIMNKLGQDGWEYQRTDTLPSEEREGLLGKATVYQNMLVFRRTVGNMLSNAPVAAAVPVSAAPIPKLKTGRERIAAKTQTPGAPTPARQEPNVAAE